MTKKTLLSIGHIQYSILFLLVTSVLANSVLGRLFDNPEYYKYFLLIHLSVQLALAVNFWIGFGAQLNETSHSLRRKILAIGAYGLCAMISTCSGDPEVSVIRMLETALIPGTILVFAVFIPEVLSTESYRSIFKHLAFFFAGSAILSLALVVFGGASVCGLALYQSVDGRGGGISATGLYSHRNTIGSFLAFFPAVFVFLYQSGTRRIGFHLLLFPILIQLALTFSRSAQGIALVSTIPLIFKKWNWGWVAVCFTSLAIICIGFVCSGDETRYIWSQYFSNGLGLLGREVYWKEVWVGFQSRPWLGYGLFGFETHDHQTPHNLFFAQIAYFGGLGTMLFILMLGTLGQGIGAKLRDVLRRHDTGLATLWLAVFLVFAQGMVEYIIGYPLFFSNSMFWLLLGFLMRNG